MDESEKTKAPLELVVTSFGYKKNPPPTANIVFDVRFLQNPYWVEELRPLSGRDQPVQDYVLKQELAQDFLQFLTNLLRKILPHMEERQIDRYTIALGCTGGQHRSATLVEALGKDLAVMFPNYKVIVMHRELDVKKPPVKSGEQTSGTTSGGNMQKAGGFVSNQDEHSPASAPGRN